MPSPGFLQSIYPRSELTSHITVIKMEFLKDIDLFAGVDAMDDLENPDDYWSKEQLDEWRKRVHEVQRTMQKT